MDPLALNFPWYSSYQFAGNKPIVAIDAEGAEEIIAIRNHLEDGTTKISLYQYGIDDNFQDVKETFRQYVMAQHNQNNWLTPRNVYSFGFEGASSNWSGRNYGALVLDTYQNGNDTKISYFNHNFALTDMLNNTKTSQQVGIAASISLAAVSVVLAIPSGGASLYLTGLSALGATGFGINKMNQINDSQTFSQLSDAGKLPQGTRGIIGFLIGSGSGNEELGAHVGNFLESALLGRQAIQEIPDAFRTQNARMIFQGIKSLYDVGSNGWDVIEDIEHRISDEDGKE